MFTLYSSKEVDVRSTIQGIDVDWADKSYIYFYECGEYPPTPEPGESWEAWLNEIRNYEPSGKIYKQADRMKEIGRKGGLSKSPLKQETARENGKKSNGRPRKVNND